MLIDFFVTNTIIQTIMLHYGNIKCTDIIPNLYGLMRMVNNIADNDAKVDLMVLFDDSHEELQLLTKHDFNFDVLYRRDRLNDEHKHIVGIKIFDVNSSTFEQKISDEAREITSMLLTLFNGNANTILKLISVKSLMPELTVFESCYLLEDVARLDEFWKKLLAPTRKIFMGDEEYDFMAESTKVHDELQAEICSYYLKNVPKDDA